MPWQQLVADVGTEINPDTGLPAFREVIVTVPRQSGKTTLVLCYEVNRAIQWSTPQRIAYTAQTGWDARRKLIDDHVPMLTMSPLKAGIQKVMRAAGNEGVMFKNGSRIDVLASSESAGHGRTLDLGVLDECFADVDDRREQAILPAMATRPAAQMLVVSTAGTESSAYLRRKVDAGRAAVADDRRDGIAYFEWSAPEDDIDIDDPSVWWSCMPALGHTISEEVVRHARQTMSEGDFRRSYLNQWTVGDERVIPVSSWASVCADDVRPEGGLVFGLDVAADRGSSAIAVADREGRVELVEHRPGVSWVVERVVELCAKWGAPISVDGFGPAASLVSAIEQAGVKVEVLSTRAMANGCASLYDAVLDGKVKVRRHVALDDAVAGARRRVTGDSWLWARRDGNVDVSPLVAVTVAFDRAHRAGPQVEPEIFFM